MFARCCTNTSVIEILENTIPIVVSVSSWKLIYDIVDNVAGDKRLQP